MKKLSAVERAERIRELEGKIVAVCIGGCRHAKWVGSGYRCTVGRWH